MLGMSESMAGVTFLAFGNGSPDVFSTYAAMSTHSGSLAIGELIGAAGFITAVVAGSMALVRPFRVARKSFVRDIGFFIIAASFSLVFLYDGKLTLWECAAMVGFYVFYVVFVVVWHWFRVRKKRKREKELAARGFFVVSGEETEIQEPYHDDPEDAHQITPRISREPSADDFSALEQGGSIRALELDDDEEVETGRLLGELSSNMRLRRPRTRTRGRSATLNPIRPSLVGALEFRSVLDSLHRMRNIQTIPLNPRRYSDDPVSTLNRQSDQASTLSGPAAAEPHQVARQSRKSLSAPRLDFEASNGSPHRGRAASAAPAVNSNPDVEEAREGATPNSDIVPETGLLRATPELNSDLTSTAGSATNTSRPALSRAMSPSFALSPPASEHVGSSDPGLYAQHLSQPSPTHLAPKDAKLPDRRGFNRPLIQRLSADTDSPDDSPKPIHPPVIPMLDTPDDQTYRSGSSSPISPFPTFTDAPRSQSPIGLPVLEYPTSASEDEYYPQDSFDDASRERLLGWWPYSIWPSPGIICSTFFPTLCCWHDKNLWEKSLGLVAAPSVFLLTITLPVVEFTKDDESAASIGRADSQRSQENILVAHGSYHFEDNPCTPTNLTSDSHHKSFGGHGDTATVAMEVENRHEQREQGASARSRHSTGPKSWSPQLPQQQAPDRDWNRWLVSLQCFTAPFFVVLILWANGTFTPSSSDVETPSVQELVKPALISLLCSLVSLALLLLTTTPTKPPRWRPLLCFVGFAVSVAWISTVAGEVVGALKTLGVVLNISDAILGLTVFAVGNSLGDLVADITVARLGYPVMALSACFGGPMLNILLGIGISGLSMMIRSADKRQHRHPQKQLKYKPYEIEVGSTLIISGMFLLITLVALLIVVPMNKWRMDRKVGWSLIVLWIFATVVNVVMEVTGFEAGWSGSDVA